MERNFNVIFLLASKGTELLAYIMNNYRILIWLFYALNENETLCFRNRKIGGTYPCNLSTLRRQFKNNGNWFLNKNYHALRLRYNYIIR